MIGNIKERTVSSKSPPLAPTPGRATGFPRAEHRSKKSAFAQRRQAPPEDSSPAAGPSSAPALPLGPQPLRAPADLSDPGASNDEKLREGISEQNDRLIAEMTAEEREQAMQEIYSRFSPEVLQRIRRGREVQASSSSKEKAVVPNEPDVTSSKDATSPVLETLRASTSRPPTPNTLRRLRFAEVKDSDVHVYESQPPSPKKTPLALGPRMPEDTDVKPLPGSSGARIRLREPEKEEEGTPGDIRRRFFPSANAHEPSLEWITSDDTMEEISPLELRFDLSGDPIPYELQISLPSHLGLHHHAGSLAGYTIEDLSLLSRSTVPAQRTVMLEVLAGLLRNLHRGTSSKGLPLPEELIVRKTDLRGRIIALGLQALSGKGTTLVRAVEVIWEGIVRWDEPTDTHFLATPVELECVKAKEGESLDAQSSKTFKDPISSLPLPHLLPFLEEQFSTPTLPPSALLQLLQVLQRVVLNSCGFARQVMYTPRLVASAVACFITKPPEGLHPAPDAVTVLIGLAESGRESASMLIGAGAADILLRFIAVLPGSDLSRSPTLVPIVAESLRFYKTLAKYGLYTHVASTASEIFAGLSRYILQMPRASAATSSFSYLCIAWLGLLEVWMVCARDPHCTTPPHEIRWSQVLAWGWSDDILALRSACVDVPEHTRTSFNVAIWHALSAWVESASVNGVRGGEIEKEDIKKVVFPGLNDGAEKDIIDSALRDISSRIGDLDVVGISKCALVLVASLRLVIALLPLTPAESSPPVPLDLGHTHDVCLKLTSESIWLKPSSSVPDAYRFTVLRPITSLCIAELQMSRRLIHTAPGNPWIRHATNVLRRLIPGDEELGDWIISELTAFITPDSANALGWRIPEDLWTKGGVEPITPFLRQALRPKFEPAANEGEDDKAVSIDPYIPTPRSISCATRITYPSTASLQRQDSTYGLPVARDFPFAPLDDLLRSGASKAFQSLPPDWSSSELEVVRATLVFAGVFNLAVGTLEGFNHPHVLLAAVKVFMLEHGQRQEDSAEEVFRDTFITNAILSLLADTRARDRSQNIPHGSESQSLEMISRRFLGSSTPFYQFYTDFVALYDAISFADPLFASLLLPPLAMSYPIDYRKLLWNDYVHILRTIRTEADHPAILDPTAFMWPIERNGEIVNAYLNGLCRTGGLHGLLRAIAIHHIAHYIWPDLAARDDGQGAQPEGESGSARDDERAKRLLLLLTSRGPHDVVKEVILYNGQYGSPISVNPLSNETRAERMEHVALWGGEPLRGRLFTLLKA